MKTFLNIEYLKKGNLKQRNAFDSLDNLNFFEKFKKYHPVLTGTIPIEIDIDTSDLDIIFECNDFYSLKKKFILEFGVFNNFKITQKKVRERDTLICRFEYNSFAFELFAQNRPVVEQEAYQHMLIEYKILLKKDLSFRNEIIKLKKQGMKTEPAFAKMLNLKGDPYFELLKFDPRSISEPLN